MTLKEQRKFYRKLIRQYKLSKLPIIGKYFIINYIETYCHFYGHSPYMLTCLFNIIPVKVDRYDWFNNVSTDTKIAYLRKAIYVSK